MKNPWTEIPLSDYENHMSLSSVFQLQALDRIMGEQFAAYPISSLAVLGVAGGNGLGNLTRLPSIREVYGIDINPEYLKVSEERYPALTGTYHTVLADINTDCAQLPEVDLVCANLFIEYVGYGNFAKAIKAMAPGFVSCVIQVDTEVSFVSDSPYAAKLEILDSVHRTVDAAELTAILSTVGYRGILTEVTPLPNGKSLRRLDFERLCS